MQQRPGKLTAGPGLSVSLVLTLEEDFLWKIYAALMQKRLSEIKLTKGGNKQG